MKDQSISLGKDARTTRSLSMPISRFLILLSAVVANAAYCADKITAPSFMNNASAADLQNAGSEINTWVVGGFAVVMALCSIVPGYHFVTGSAQKGWEQAKFIILGGALAAVLGAIAFSVVEALS